uniref:Helicase C-terminal domain-containing protein n=1 Tax=Setaria viridis TaxID=4556 RepID=A0A4V6DCL0_SETVI|nr:hypothetical protein SEVIR_1G035200v2 [Setaria viridis]
MRKKAVPEQELSGKKRCYACKETSHSLDQCSIKYKPVTVAHEFGYATEYPFIMIHPSEEMLEKEKFYHHCLLITSDVSNLDLGILKVQLQKLWNLPGSWVLRRECSKSFLASFSSEGDVVSCVKNPNMEMVMDDKEVKLTLTRWSEGEDEMCGVPRKYRGWAELYEVVSMFGVLIDVDVGSLEVGDKDPIRLKVALRNHDGAPFSYNVVLGWSSRMVMLTVEAKIDSENKDHNTRIVTSTGNHVLDFGDSSEKEHEKEVINASQSILLEESMCINESRLDGKTKENKISTPAATVNNSKETTIESSEPEGVQSICQNSTIMIGEDRFRGIPKPPIKHVFKRRVIVPRDEELKDIIQFYVKVKKEEMKLSKLYALLHTGKVRNVIIFVNTKDKVMSLSQDVGKHYNVSASHDDMDQHARDAAIQKFRSGSSSILIAADLRGTNAVKVPVVINYDLPTQPMQYIHRVQQQNRQPGKRSVFINLVTRADECIHFEIQRFCNGQVKELSDM